MSSPKQKYPLLVILGPTAVGKTDFSLTLAEELKGEIISADSMQIYQGMDIGTAKLDKEMRQGIPHHLLDIVKPDQQFSVADYQNRVDSLIPEIIERNHLPILVGGTGLYIRAVVEGFLLPEMEVDQSLRVQLQQKAEVEGSEAVHSLLEEIDPEEAARLHPHDLRRVIRAIEIYQQTGKTKSHFRRLQAERGPRYQTLKLGLTRKRTELYNRINLRVDQMLQEGLAEEVKDLLQAGFQLSTTALQGLGYKEIAAYLEGEYDLEEAVRVLKRDTRHYAKRQLTWFRRDKSIHWFNLSELSGTEAAEAALKLSKNYFKEWI